jgi:hypothetical protein
MLKTLNPTLHAVLDYALAVAFLVLPGVLGFPHDSMRLAQIFGMVYLGASLLTRYPLGAIKLIPFPVHGIMESVLAAVWVVAPWLFKFSQHAAARNFYVAAGVALLAVVLLTDYRATGAGHAAGLARRDSERRERLVDRRQRYLRVEADRRAGPSDRRLYAAG